MSPLRIRRKSKPKGIDEKRLMDVLGQELSSYVKRAELQEYLEGIESDKKKKKLWDSLSVHKKIKVLRYALERKGAQHDKKR